MALSNLLAQDYLSQSSYTDRFGVLRRSSVDAGLANVRATGGLAHRQIQQACHRFHVADRQADVAAPDVGHRDAAAVVGRIHAQRVALVETGDHRLQPVAAVGMRRAGETPETTGSVGQFVGGVAPAGDLQCRAAVVAVAGLQHGEARQAVEECHRHFLLEVAVGASGGDRLAARAVARVRNRLFLVAGDDEVLDRAIGQQQAFAGLVGSQRFAVSHQAGVQVTIEGDRQGGVPDRCAITVMVATVVGFAAAERGCQRHRQVGPGHPADHAAGNKLQYSASSNRGHGEILSR